ncbi:BPSS1780 family membrane protein [uncultured Aquabacterium sp.]|jgi:hypothetical protein|uniref:BPSS1780 family membrane protein n=1 Tax=uncultured Aquabacterium sp. TaxID=158753 RepID=UPI002620C977|nr:BPSS1780 family membrane protein [uncultured Aquabacterium sp.]
MKLRLVKPAQGLVWVRQGLLLGKRQPLNFVGLLGLVASVALLLMGLSVIGPLLLLAAMPMVWMGFMLASRHALAGEKIPPSVLIEAVRTQPEMRKAFARLGGAYVAATLVVMQLAHVLGPGADVLAEAFDTAQDAGEILANPLVQQDLLWRMALTLPVSLLFWHTPALILWARQPLAKALFFSWIACWRNLGAFVVYGAAWAVLILLVGLIDSVIAMVLPVPAVVNVLAVATGLWVAAAFYASLYFTVVDCFDAPGTPPDGSSPGQDVSRDTPSSGQA